MYKAQLKTFITVCETGSFSRAAAKLFITPSAVIQQINALEKDLSVTLFLRSQKGVQLTEAGEYLSVQGKDYMHFSDQIRRQLVCVKEKEGLPSNGAGMLTSYLTISPTSWLSSET